MQIVIKIPDELKESLEKQNLNIEDLVGNTLSTVFEHFVKKNSNTDVTGTIDVNSLSPEEYDKEFNNCTEQIRILIDKYGDQFFEDAWGEVLDFKDNNKTKLSLWEEISE